MKKQQPIKLVDLLSKLDKLLIDLLSGLSIEDWNRQSIAPKWNVKDIAVHLLDGNLRTLSMLRDGYNGEEADSINSYQDLVAFLNELNSTWVTATKRLSPKVITDLLESSGKEYCDYLKTLNLDEKAEFAVAWAGESESKNWFHIAREYTEKWLHQQQIRLAVGLDIELLQENWFYPYLDVSVRALPHHYRNIQGLEGDLIQFEFQGKTSKCWFLYYSNKWELYESIDKTPVCEVIIQDELAWRIFSKGINKEEAIQKSIIKGKRELGLKIFDMITIMA